MIDLLNDPSPDIPPWFPLETGRLILRDAVEADLADLHAYASDPEVARYMQWGPNRDVEETRAAMEGWLAQQAQRPRRAFNLVVELKAERRVVGSVRLEVQDVAGRAADFGYCFARDVWGRGVATEAAGAVLDAGFGALRLRRIWATCDARNLASARVLTKLGMRLEGRLRQDQCVKGFWRDTLMFGRLQSEWALAAEGNAPDRRLTLARAYGL